MKPAFFGIALGLLLVLLMVIVMPVIFHLGRSWDHWLDKVMP